MTRSWFVYKRLNDTGLASLKRTAKPVLPCGHLAGGGPAWKLQTSNRELAVGAALTNPSNSEVVAQRIN